VCGGSASRFSAACVNIIVWDHRPRAGQFHQVRTMRNGETTSTTPGSRAGRRTSARMMLVISLYHACGLSVILCSSFDHYRTVSGYTTLNTMLRHVIRVTDPARRIRTALRDAAPLRQRAFIQTLTARGLGDLSSTATETFWTS
jgi:hypothetical protein